MAFKYEKVKPNPAKNAPRIKDEYLTPEDYTGEIVDGFSRMYQMVVNKRETLLGTELGTDSLFSRLFDNMARFVFRATDLYASMLNHSIHPDYQHEGVDLSLQLDILSRSFLSLEEKPRLWPLIREEQRSLWEVDIPKFTAQGISDSLGLDCGEVVQQCFSGSSCEYVKEKIRGLNEKDLEWQVELIKGSMEARTRLEEMSSSHAYIFPWRELTPEETQKLKEEEGPDSWRAVGTSPFYFEGKYEPQTSLGLRVRGEVVGWMVNHQIEPDTILYGSYFVRPKYRGKGLSIGLLLESVKLQKKAGISHMTWYVEATNNAARKLYQKMVGPCVTLEEEWWVTTKTLSES